KYECLLPESLYIVNTDIRASDGEHWVLIFWKNKYELPFYFDSYGLHPIHEEIFDFITSKSPSKYFSFNKQQLQGLTSSVCGHYVAYVSSQLCCGFSIEYIRSSRFSLKDTAKNDKIVVGL